MTMSHCISTRVVAVLLLACFAPLAAAAVSSAQLLTPRYTSVAGGESQVFSVMFLDAAGRAATGEAVRFSNDACGLFENGSGSIDKVTDARGIAVAIFTARNPPGITCWVNAASGNVRAIFDVLTYRLGGAYVTATVSPARYGQPFTITAQPQFGIYKLANVEMTATVIPGSAGAAVFPAAGNTGSAGKVDFVVTPDGSIGDYEVEVDFRGHKFVMNIVAPERPWQDMWWAGEVENGWGVSIVQHRDQLFAVLYAYDAEGNPTWYVIPGGAWDESRRTFTGSVYAPRGSPFYAYDRARFDVGAKLGTASLTFNSGDNATLDFTISGVTGRKVLSRQLFGPVDVAVPSGIGDMWWGGDAQNGWGIAVLQQYRTLFMVWFTYDASGAPRWYVMPQGSWIDGATYDGRIFRTTGAPWLGRIYDPARFATTDVGSYRFRLTDSGATLSYSIDGRSGMLDLVRQPF